MADIIDFDKMKARGGKDMPAIDDIEQDMEDFRAFVTQNTLTAQVGAVMTDQLQKLALLQEITTQAINTIQSAGMDVEDFELDHECLTLFQALPLPEGKLDEPEPESMWNGPRFVAEDDRFQTVVASTVVWADGKVEYVVDLFRLAHADDRWKYWADGRWEMGPPEDAFSCLDAIRRMSLMGDDFEDDDEDDDEDDEDELFDSEDDESWEDSVFSLDLPQGVILSLSERGFLQLDQLRSASDAELLAIDGIGKRTLKRIRKALSDADDLLF